MTYTTDVVDKMISDRECQKMIIFFHAQPMLILLSHVDSCKGVEGTW